jgi:hypothetical protein
VRALGPSDSGVSALLDDGSVVNVGGGPSPVIGSDEAASAVSGSRDQQCVVLLSGGVKCLNGEAGPMLDDRFTPPRNIIGIAAGENQFLCGLLGDGSARCWFAGELHGCSVSSPRQSYWCDQNVNVDGSFSVLLPKPAIALATGAYGHVCALLANGRIQCWGDPGSPYAPLGASVEFVPNALDASTPSWTYGAWHPVDLGTLP